MTISNTISQTAATNPLVGAAVAKQSLDSALLSSAQTGDAGTTALLEAIHGQALQENQLLTSASPTLGQHINITA
jgi:hypothetical protein